MTEWDYIFERDWNKYNINAILEKVGNTDYNPFEFRKDVVNTAYRAMWKFYQIV